MGNTSYFSLSRFLRSTWADHTVRSLSVDIPPKIRPNFVFCEKKKICSGGGEKKKKKKIFKYLKKN